jgi:hypothetical protein
MSEQNYKVLLTSGDLIKIDRLISLTRFGGFAQEWGKQCRDLACYVWEQREQRERGKMGQIV